MTHENGQSPRLRQLQTEPGQTLSRSIERARRLSIEAIVSDLELALTFLDTARASRDPATIARCHRNALKAYLKTNLGARKLKPAASAEQRVRMEQLRESIRVRLAAFYGWTSGEPPPAVERSEK